MGAWMTLPLVLPFLLRKLPAGGRTCGVGSGSFNAVLFLNTHTRRHTRTQAYFQASLWFFFFFSFRSSPSPCRACHPHPSTRVLSLGPVLLLEDASWVGLVPVSGFNKPVSLPLSRAPNLGLQVKVQGKRVSEKGRSRLVAELQVRSGSNQTEKGSLSPGLQD